jgi:hypothetical protein
VTHRTFAVFALIVCLAAGFARAADEPEVGKPVKLFNGKDMTGWTFFLKDNGKMADVWSVKPDGVLYCKGNPIGYIRTEKDYTNFKLTLEWRHPGPKPGNSGVLLRMTGEDKVWPKSIEAQLHHLDAGDIWNIDKVQMTVAPERTTDRRTKKLHETNEKPLGEWNKYEITLDGGNLELKVNDLVQNTATNVAEVPGKICLQSEGAEIEFRNIELTPLPTKKSADAAPKGSADAKRTLEGLPGWHITGNGNWVMKDGVIEGEQGESEKSYTHVVSDKSYKDFKATLKFKCLLGNSGFYFRVKPDDKGLMHGFQSEIDEYNSVGGLYESYGRQWVAKPDDSFVKTYYKPHEWNDMTVEAKGTRVVVYVNGTKVSDIDDNKQSMEGPFALQIHGGQDVHVMFKDIHIEEQ